MSLPKISVITPSYNQGEFIEETIQSVIDQDYPNIEYFVFDGGSTDETLSVIKKSGEHITYWESKNDRGQSHALNKGLARVTGDIVCYINSDDYFSPGAFMHVANKFQEGVTWLAGGVDYVDINRQRINLWIPDAPNDIKQWLGGFGGLPQPGVFLARDLIAACGDFREDLNYVFDTEYWIRLLSQGYNINYTEQVLAIRRIHDDCKTLTSINEFTSEMERVAKKYVELLKDSEKNEVKRLQRKHRTRIRLNQFRENKNNGLNLSAYLNLFSAFTNSPVDFLSYINTKYLRN